MLPLVPDLFDFTPTPRPPPVKSAMDRSAELACVSIAVIIGAVVVTAFLKAVIPVIQRIRLRRAGCPKCGGEMRQLSELAEESKLSPQQKREEAIGSVDYLVFGCVKCKFTRTEKTAGANREYSQCPWCGRMGFERIVMRRDELHGKETVTTKERCSMCKREEVSSRVQDKKKPRSPWDKKRAPGQLTDDDGNLL